MSSPREGLVVVVLMSGQTRPLMEPRGGRRQAGLDTPISRMPTVAPGPKARSDLASR